MGTGCSTCCCGRGAVLVGYRQFGTEGSSARKSVLCGHTPSRRLPDEDGEYLVEKESDGGCLPHRRRRVRRNRGSNSDSSSDDGERLPKSRRTSRNRQSDIKSGDEGNCFPRKKSHLKGNHTRKSDWSDIENSSGNEDQCHPRTRNQNKHKPLKNKKQVCSDNNENEGNAKDDVSYRNNARTSRNTDYSGKSDHPSERYDNESEGNKSNYYDDCSQTNTAQSGKIGRPGTAPLYPYLNENLPNEETANYRSSAYINLQNYDNKSGHSKLQPGTAGVPVHTDANSQYRSNGYLYEQHPSAHINSTSYDLTHGNVTAKNDLNSNPNETTHDNVGMSSNQCKSESNQQNSGSIYSDTAEVATLVLPQNQKNDEIQKEQTNHISNKEKDSSNTDNSDSECDSPTKTIGNEKDRNKVVSSSVHLPVNKTVDILDNNQSRVHINITSNVATKKMAVASEDSDHDTDNNIPVKITESDSISNNAIDTKNNSEKSSIHTNHDNGTNNGSKLSLHMYTSNEVEENSSKVTNAKTANKDKVRNVDPMNATVKSKSSDNSDTSDWESDSEIDEKNAGNKNVTTDVNTDMSVIPVTIGVNTDTTLPRDQCDKEKRSTATDAGSNMSALTSTTINTDNVPAPEKTSAGVNTENDLSVEDLMKKIEELQAELAIALATKGSTETVIKPVIVIVREIEKIQDYTSAKQVVNNSTSTQDTATTNAASCGNSDESNERDLEADDRIRQMKSRHHQALTDIERDFAEKLSNNKGQLTNDEVNRLLKDYFESLRKLKRQQELERQQLKEKLRDKLNARKKKQNSDEYRELERNKHQSNVQKSDEDIKDKNEYESDFDEDDDDDSDAHNVSKELQRVLEADSVASNASSAKHTSDSESIDSDEDTQHSEQDKLFHELKGDLLEKTMNASDFKELLALYREEQDRQRNKMNADRLRQDGSLWDKLEARSKRKQEQNDDSTNNVNNDPDSRYNGNSATGGIEVQTDSMTVFVTDAEVQTIMEELLDDEQKKRQIQIMDKNFARKLNGKKDLSDNEVEELLRKHLESVAKLEQKKEQQRLRQLGIMAEKLEERRANKSKNQNDSNTNLDVSDDILDTEEYKQLENMRNDILARRQDWTEDDIKQLLEKYHQRRQKLMRKQQFEKLKTEEEIKKRLEERRKKHMDKQEENLSQDNISNDANEPKQTEKHSNKATTDDANTNALDKEVAVLDGKFYRELEKKKRNNEFSEDILQQLLKEHMEKIHLLKKKRQGDKDEDKKKLSEKIAERKRKLERKRREEEQQKELEENEGRKLREMHKQLQEEEENARKYSLQRVDSVIDKAKIRKNKVEHIIKNDKERNAELLKAKRDARKKKRQNMESKENRLEEETAENR